MRKRAKRKKKSNGTEAARTYILKHVMATGPKRVKWKTLVEREAKGDESNNDDKEDDENSSEESSSDSSSSDEYKSEVNMGMDNSYDANAYGEFFDPSYEVDFSCSGMILEQISLKIFISFGLRKLNYWSSFWLSLIVSTSCCIVILVRILDMTPCTSFTLESSSRTGIKFNNSQSCGSPNQESSGIQFAGYSSTDEGLASIIITDFMSLPRCTMSQTKYLSLYLLKSSQYNDLNALLSGSKWLMTGQAYYSTDDV